ncbi:MAG: TetR/AcrR family transcriptional regulator [Actinobacteria bacterium]|nr:TetR/AcrR family transcriptional regulator [Actinomycetota bacterium]
MSDAAVAPEPVDGEVIDDQVAGGDAPEDDVTATDGRVIGRRAIQTRRRLLDVTAVLLAERGALDLKVIDVARAVGASPATFYQYFADVEDAILALATELATAVAPISSMLDVDWSDAEGLDRAREFVAAYIRFWDDNGPVLRILMLRADDRDERFRAVRRAYSEPFMVAMVAKVRHAQGSGQLAAALDAEATAGAVLAALDRLPNYRQNFEKRGTSRDAMIETVARLAHTALTGHPLR